MNEYIEKIKQVNININNCGNYNKKKELIKYKHRLEKQLKLYMFNMNGDKNGFR